MHLVKERFLAAAIFQSANRRGIRSMALFERRQQGAQPFGVRIFSFINLPDLN
jgi:hypothetical protein